MVSWARTGFPDYFYLTGFSLFFMVWDLTDFGPSAMQKSQALGSALLYQGQSDERKKPF
jgi:hypothetical protein